DSTGASAWATVRVTVTDLNAPQIGQAPAPYSVLHDQVLTVDAATGLLVNATDADPTDTVTAVVVGNGGTAQGGTVAIAADGSFVYTPKAGYVGTDTFQYTAYDGALSSAAVTVSVNVTDTAPVAANYTVGVHAGQPLSVGAGWGVLSLDSDPDGDA